MSTATTPTVVLDPDVVLGALAELGGEVTVEQLARRIGAEPRDVLRTLNGLRQVGLVVRIVRWEHQAQPAVWRRP